MNGAEQHLRPILWQLREYLPELVVIGGWVPDLYRRFGDIPGWTLQTPFTREVDFLVHPAMPRRGGETIPEVLRRAGFEPVGEVEPAAAWSRRPGSGEMVEFLISHSGTAIQRGNVVPVPGHDGLGAVALAGLDLLRGHTRTLTVPLGLVGGALQEARVNVPSLGIYVVHKAITFPHRPGIAAEMTHPRRTKDLLYLRDLMAAGEAVVARIEHDLRAALRTHPSLAAPIRTARQNVGLALSGALQAALPEVAQAMSERSGFSGEVSMSDLRGFLTDLRTVLDDILNG